MNGETDLVDDWGKTALIYACKRDCVETVKYLLEEKEANIDYKMHDRIPTYNELVEFTL